MRHQRVSVTLCHLISLHPLYCGCPAAGHLQAQHTAVWDIKSLVSTVRLSKSKRAALYSLLVHRIGAWARSAPHVNFRMAAGAVGKALPFGPQTAEHCILGADLQPSRKPAAQPLEEAEVKLLMDKIGAWEAWLKRCETDVPKGYIFSKEPGKPGRHVPMP